MGLNNLLTRLASQRAELGAVAGGNGSSAAASSPLPPGAPPATHPVLEIYENQRWLGLAGWQPPVALLDPPRWSDDSGNEIDPSSLASQPSLESPDWEVIVSPSTDTEGWQYATVFGHLPHPRAGGRASQRLGDMTRRRAWRRRDRTVAGEAVGVGPPTAAAVAAARARESEAKAKAIRGFITMLLDLVSRRNVWTLVPWDPSAVYFLFKRHREIYERLQTQARERRLFGGDSDPHVAPPPSLLHPTGGATLLQDLLAAAAHARAAYGFAAAAGHVDSVGAYIRLQTVQQVSFNAAGGASAEANDQAVAALAGVAPEDILFSHWRAAPFRPCHYVAIDRQAQAVVVAIRGTLEIGDLLSDLAAHPMEASFDGTEGWVHPGIFAAASFIHCTTEKALARAAEKCPGWPVLLCGHSLGGGVAALLAALLRERGGVPGLGPIYAITLGSAAVVSETLAAGCEEYVVSLILGSDVIPHLSYASVEALLVEASEASPVRRAAEGLRAKLTEVLGGGGNGNGGEAAAAAGETLETAKEARQKAAKEMAEAASETVPSHQIIPIIEEEQPRGAGASPVAAQTTAGNQVDNGAASSLPLAPLDSIRAATPPPEVPVLKITESGTVLNERDDVAVAVSAHPPDILYGGLEGDSGLAGTAMAQSAAAAGTSAAGPTAGGDSDAPELLFPPGRLLWIFPADEDLSRDLEEDSLDLMETSEAELIAAWDSAWGGGTAAADAEDEGPADAVEGVVQEKRQHSTETRSGGGGGEGGAVNMDEAAAEVGALGGTSGSEGEGGAGKQRGAGQRRAVAPVVVEAERAPFERLLFMPDCLNDHLPHKYLDALQKL